MQATATRTQGRIEKLPADTDVHFSESFPVDGRDMFVEACNFSRAGHLHMVTSVRHAGGRAHRRRAGSSLPSAASFVSADRFRQDLHAMVGERAGSLKYVVFEASRVIDIDYTAAQTLREVIYCRDVGITFSIARLESVRAQEALERFGIAAMLGPARIAVAWMLAVLPS